MTFLQYSQCVAFLDLRAYEHGWIRRIPDVRKEVTFSVWMMKVGVLWLWSWLKIGQLRHPRGCDLERGKEGLLLVQKEQVIVWEK